MDWMLLFMIGVAGAVSTFGMIELFRWGYNKENKNK
jgi:hypothetical protein